MIIDKSKQNEKKVTLSAIQEYVTNYIISVENIDLYIYTTERR
jgi:hypothetical protein